jgi:hypothetical protein
MNGIQDRHKQGPDNGGGDTGPIVYFMTIRMKPNESLFHKVQITEFEAMSKLKETYGQYTAQAKRLLDKDGAVTVNETNKAIWKLEKTRLASRDALMKEEAEQENL